MRNVTMYGDVTGAEESIWLDQRGGLFANLMLRLSASELLNGLAGMSATFVWAGTWSFARLPEVLLAGLVAFAALGFSAYVLISRKQRQLDIWLPAILVVPSIGALAYHVLITIAFSGSGAGTPGYYLHLLAVPLAFAFAVGIHAAWRRAKLRPLAACLALYTFAYLIVVSWLQLGLFTGCVVRAQGSAHYELPPDPSCLVNAPQIGERLSVLALPSVGAPAWALAVLVLAAAVALHHFTLHMSRQSDSNTYLL
jgi:hypothetical protein